MTNLAAVDEKHTKAENTTAILRQDIITCIFPPGSKLPFDKLAKHYNVSVSTLRESLTTLVVEGLVNSIPHRGYWASEVSRQDLHDLTITRTAIEIEALRLSIEYGGDEWEGKIVQALHFLNRESDPKTKAEKYQNQRYHFNLHEALYSACGSGRMIALCEALDYQSNRYRHIFYEAMYTSKQHWVNHSNIVDAALDRDAGKACELLKKHIHESAHFLIHDVSDDEWQDRLNKICLP